jgi:hypothetical protein
MIPDKENIKNSCWHVPKMRPKTIGTKLEKKAICLLIELFGPVQEWTYPELIIKYLDKYW